VPPQDERFILSGGGLWGGMSSPFPTNYFPPIFFFFFLVCVVSVYLVSGCCHLVAEMLNHPIDPPGNNNNQKQKQKRENMQFIHVLNKS
jgi:hypothetical protein